MAQDQDSGGKDTQRRAGIVSCQCLVLGFPSSGEVDLGLAEKLS